MCSKAKRKWRDGSGVRYQHASQAGRSLYVWNLGPRPTAITAPGSSSSFEFWFLLLFHIPDVLIHLFLTHDGTTCCVARLHHLGSLQYTLLFSRSVLAPAFHIFVFQLFFFWEKISWLLRAPQISTSLHHPPLWRISVFNVFFHLQLALSTARTFRLATDFSAFFLYIFSSLPPYYIF